MLHWKQQCWQEEQPEWYFRRINKLEALLLPYQTNVGSEYSAKDSRRIEKLKQLLANYKIM